jgi:hypothetical protein
MTSQIYHSGYPIGAVDYVPRSFKRRGAFIRYVSAGNVIWLFRPDVKCYFAQLKGQSPIARNEPRNPPTAVES